MALADNSRSHVWRQDFAERYQKLILRHGTAAETEQLSVKWMRPQHAEHLIRVSYGS